jgi:hypothetical protein
LKTYLQNEPGIRIFFNPGGYTGKISRETYREDIPEKFMGRFLHRCSDT